jgi:hypothetical protein
MRAHTAVALGIGMLLVNVACKEREPSASAAPPDKIERMSVVDVVPLADGGAYAIGTGEGLWYVRGAEAVRVREVPTLPTAAASGDRHREGWLLALAAHERGKRRQLEEAQKEEEPDPGERDRDF